jgi:hypothetical protein
MPSRLRIVVVVFAVATTAFALTACTTGTDPSGHPTHSVAAPTGGVATTASCLAGTWSQDTNDTAHQVLQYLIGKGAPVTDARGDGPVELTIGSDGTMTYRSGVNYEFSANGGDAGSMTITQSQIGTSQGDWGFSGASDSTLEFSGWTGSIAITNAVQIGGQSADFPITLPNDGPGATPMSVICTRSTLKTQVAPSPFTLTWNRE